MNYKEYYDKKDYKTSLRESLRALKLSQRDGEEYIYIIKNIISLDDFLVKNTALMQKLFFYSFYSRGKVSFTNNYSFYFWENLSLSLFSLHKDYKNISHFHQYFAFGENEIFLSNICDMTNWKKWEQEREAFNIIEYFLYFTFECSELYSFSWEHFPLYKWLIWELVE